MNNENNCIEQIKKEFHQKFNTITSIKYHYDLVEVFKNIVTKTKDEQYRIYEELINYYLTEIKKTGNNNIINEFRFNIETALDFFDFEYFHNNNGEVK